MRQKRSLTCYTFCAGGKSVFSAATKDVDIKTLANKMVGHEVAFNLKRLPNDIGEAVVSLNQVRILDNAQETVSFDIHAGEILGIAGVEGNGQMQLEEILMGLQKCKEGSIIIKGDDVTKWSTRKRLEKGISYIPSERHQRAILSDFSISDNLFTGKSI